MSERFIIRRLLPCLACGVAVLLILPAQAAGLTGADSNQDGKISRSEADAAQDRAFKQLDTDGDGRIDAKEFDAGQPGLPDDADKGAKKRRHRVVSSWFKHMDANGDGAISRSEYRKALTPYFDRLDSDGDGYISSGELKKAFSRGRGHSSGAGQ